MSARPIRTYAILPAAGRSTRIGRPKLLLPLADGRLLIEHVLTAWRASRVGEIVVVMRRDDEALAASCRGLRTSIVQPEIDPPDMKASIAAGLDYLRATYTPSDDDAWLVAPADMPLLPTTAIDAVIAAFSQQLVATASAAVRSTAKPTTAPSIIVPHFKGRRGHPVLFAWRLASEVARLAPDEGLNRLLERYPSLPVEVADEGILSDVDTPEDYARLREGAR
ncbi:MAG: NTP transferase domain-containing protein [Pirellulales bacterium]